MKEVSLTYIGSDYNQKAEKERPITCKFRILYSQEDGKIREIVEKCIKWLAVGPPMVLTKNKETNFELEITGRGHDFRCGHCRQFRTRLKNALNEDGFKLKQRRFCRFDEEGDYSFSEIEILKKRKALMEMEVEEATQEEYDRLCKKIRELEREE